MERHDQLNKPYTHNTESRDPWHEPIGTASDSQIVFRDIEPEGMPLHALNGVLASEWLQRSPLPTADLILRQLWHHEAMHQLYYPIGLL